MSRRIAIILNPVAGRGKARKLRARLDAILEETAIGLSIPGSSYWRIIESQGAGHSEELAREAAAFGFDAIAAAGGDGTLSEVANGIAGTECLLGVIPLGTGNDFARCVGIGTDLELAVETLFIGEARKIDVGRVTFPSELADPFEISEARGRRSVARGEVRRFPIDAHVHSLPIALSALMPPPNRELEEKSESRLFLNIAGCGIDAVVADRVNRGFGFLSGTSAYLAALAQSLLTYKAAKLTLTMGEEVWEERAMFCCVANATSYGGGMKVAPDAELEDGFFDICLLKETGKIEFLRTFPKVYSGTHIDHPNVEIVRTDRISIQSDPPLPVLVDGEVLGMTPVEFQIVPQAISFLFPKPNEVQFPSLIRSGSPLSGDIDSDLKQN